ncbi:tubulin-tyrosine ligase [Rhizoctonia solani 123E]|uniref:Tubulin-tyrosine ligase n=1 Tax=Rhizoctonia solani 123E TaxID=1423351 RepID=A0A074S5X1_9AGAM|nr:tubulin-tyrosine ligase [Rhizoctonia solani 123E]
MSRSDVDATAMKNFTAYVTWPSDLIVGLVETALRDIGGPEVLSQIAPEEHADPGPLLQWTTYDSLVHALTLEYLDTVLTSSYNIRKALIRKHFLHQTITSYLTKTPNSVLRKAVPQTWLIDISFADELDDAWADELWDLSIELEKNDKWFILKPGMADRGQGIRMFNTRESLYSIFESFEDNSSDEESVGSGVDAQGNSKTAVMTSQLRHFVIQEYLGNPLLVDPAQTMTPTPSKDMLRGRKFHMRVYCVASGALKLFMSPNILALFAGSAYTPPSSQSEDDPSDMDLSPHLTNTALQDNVHESSIRLLTELVGCDILSAPGPGTTFRLEDVQDLENQVSNILAETFKAALASAVHFQVLPNAFELFGVDFLVTHAPEPESETSRFQVNLLEINAEPAIELTGARLNWVLVDLFKGIAHTCVKPFFEGTKSASSPDQGPNQWLRKCLDIETRKY